MSPKVICTPCFFILNFATLDFLPSLLCNFIYYWPEGSNVSKYMFFKDAKTEAGFFGSLLK